MNHIKNNLIIIGLGALVAIAGFLNFSKETKTETEFNMVDMSEVTSFSATETGLYLSFLDGGYYLEVPNTTEETHYTYVICDVVDFYGDELCDYAINLVCKMPDGTLHTYVIEDPPAEAELVCFKTVNQDDYTTYEVVAVR